eukprot:TRINITY_DN11012_c0_g2_i3.p1 TRINITY_DN11012_c0_g2~~TRINITY_DN11012_c0_g2_i3.p1  ORF type:complete len:104 (-),score=9.67 TRINITY_DN11012_c0_g2_i3:50-361(-)
MLRLEQSLINEDLSNNELDDWQRMLLYKKQDVVEWCMRNNVVVSTELTHLWDQAMSLGEEKGKRVYQKFLNKWQEFQKNPQSFLDYKGPVSYTHLTLPTICSV